MTDTMPEKITDNAFFSEHFSKSSAQCEILVVDNNVRNLKAIRHILSTVDAHIIYATCGSEALALTLHHSFSVILLDVFMPIMDGFEVATRLGQSEKTRCIPVIFITANTQYKNKNHHPGVTEYIYKPVDSEVLLDKVRTFIQIYEQKSKIQKALKKNQQLGNCYSFLSDTVTEGVIGVDINGIISFSNPAENSLLTSKHPSPVGKPLMQYLKEKAPTNNRHWLSGKIYEHCCRGDHYHQDTNAYWNNGCEDIPVEYTATPILRNSIFDGVVISFKDIRERNIAEKKLIKLAHYDCLTNLCNRSTFHDHLKTSIARADRANHNIAILFLDLDLFKSINDSLGHDCGDKLLISTAHRLSNCVRETDVVSRFGGDEFAIFLEIDNDINNSVLIAKKIITEIERPFSLGVNQVFISASIGISIYAPETSESIETLLKQADIALYQAKKKGRGNFQFFTQEMQIKVDSHLSIESKLREAQAHDEFFLYYQPQVNINSAKIVSLESLIRWRKPDGELISPENFIPIAEKTGLIDSIGKWVLNTACLQCSIWNRNRNINNKLRVSVNASARQFKNNNILESITEALKTARLHPSLLCIELTESTIMQDTESIIRQINALHNIGVKIAIDDFGTGYSSLKYLQQLPVDILKIDPYFINDLNNNNRGIATCKTIIELADNMGFNVIAEGVQTTSQLSILRNLGCEVIQGYLFSKPQTADQIQETIHLNENSSTAPWG
ncbi:diguanylate cyclase/phosphodiesterase (GGDEF & EAL domains) with PAS/PAC sensor(s) [hydrothermal vent metagenome]|uniref:Diguanylate cyclase/phosphodiesterase (GGDEF & EAL domains) with PAS/PAC sensor(S) n=1 Tax=hydrothermal vent metagenome TaxID=652676 RepID=A0A3B0Y8X6_9ZZZZ